MFLGFGCLLGVAQSDALDLPVGFCWLPVANGQCPGA